MHFGDLHIFLRRGSAVALLGVSLSVCSKLLVMSGGHRVQGTGSLVAPKGGVLNAVAVLASDNRYYFDTVCFQRNYRSD